MAASSPSAPDNWGVVGKAENERVNLIADRAAQSAASGSGAAGAGPATERFVRATPEQCALFNGLDDPGTDLARGCGPGQRLAPNRLECAPDAHYLGALYRQTRTIGPDGTPGPWTPAGDPITDQSCVTPADLAVEAERALATMTITPSPITVQPGNGWTLVNLPTITHTTTDPQELATTLLGVPVTLRVTPASYTWDYGDGASPLTTTDPGAPYPDHTVHHTYTQPTAPDSSATITLTTTWSAHFNITGAPTWTPIAGAPTTTTTAPPLTVHEARSRLVTDALD